MGHPDDRSGAEAGHVVGVEVIAIRPPGEAVIHPVTRERLCCPEIEIVAGEVTTMAGSASMKIRKRPLLSIQPGDMGRFMTSEEETVMDQERRQIRSNVKKLTKNIRNTQSNINTLKGAIGKLDRIDESIKVQLLGIDDEENKEILEGASYDRTAPPVAKDLRLLDDPEMAAEEGEELSFMDQYGLFWLIGVVGRWHSLPSELMYAYNWFDVLWEGRSLPLNLDVAEPRRRQLGVGVDQGGNSVLQMVHRF